MIKNYNKILVHCKWSGDIFYPVWFYHHTKLKGYSDQSMHYAETCLNTSSPKKMNTKRRDDFHWKLNCVKKLCVYLCSQNETTKLTNN